MVEHTAVVVQKSASADDTSDQIVAEPSANVEFLMDGSENVTSRRVEKIPTLLATKFRDAGKQGTIDSAASGIDAHLSRQSSTMTWGTQVSDDVIDLTDYRDVVIDLTEHRDDLQAPSGPKMLHVVDPFTGAVKMLHVVNVAPVMVGLEAPSDRNTA